MLLGLLNDLFLLALAIIVHCAASGETLTLPAVVQHDRGSSLPVIVTATLPTSSSAKDQLAGKPTEETSRVVTTTEIVFTTTTALTTISSRAKESAVSPSNALEVLSDALQSFSSIGSAKTLLPPIKGHSETSNEPSHSPVPTLASSSAHEASLSTRLSAGGKTDRTTTSATTQSRTATLAGDQITASSSAVIHRVTTQLSIISRSHSSTPTDRVSAPHTLSISKGVILTTQEPSSITAASTSTNVTAIFGNGQPQGTFTASQSGAVPSLGTHTKLEMAAAALALVTFLLR